VQQDYSIDPNHLVFGRMRYGTHGFNSGDFGLGPHRNAAIVKTIYSVINLQLKSRHFSTFLLRAQPHYFCGMHTNSNCIIFTEDKDIFETGITAHYVDGNTPFSLLTDPEE
jgi:hypothetical protein